VNFFDPKRTFRRLSHFLKSWKTLIWGPESPISPNPPNLSFGFEPPPKSLIECDGQALHHVEAYKDVIYNNSIFYILVFSKEFALF